MVVNTIELIQRALVAYSQGRIDQVAAACRQALTIDPNEPSATHLLGIAALRSGRTDDAIELLDRAVSLSPSAVDFRNNLGLALIQARRFSCAVDVYHRAIDIAPNMPELFFNLGISYQADQALEQAELAFGQAHRLSPEAVDYLSAWIHVRQRLCDWDDIENLADRIVQAVEQSPRKPIDGDVSPLGFLSLPIPTTAEQQLQCAKLWTSRISNASNSNRAGAKRVGDRMRIGYLSADFRDHPVGWLIPEMIESHDRSRLEVFGYYIGRSENSEIAQRLQVAFDYFRDLSRLSWAEAAELIRRDRIDILIDLQGHTQDARIEILAARPAPIQATYLGYPSSFGADYIDYVIVDSFVVPLDQQPFYSERLVHLPHCFLVQDGQAKIAAVPSSRRAAGLSESALVLCAFSNYYKITPRMFDCWMRILHTVPDAVLWLREGPVVAMDRLRRRAEASGVEAERLIYAPRLDRPEHLARQSLPDLFVDTFPYNQHSTAADALRVGLPVVTLAGSTFASRVAGSLLKELGLPELITSDMETYENTVVELLTNDGRLSEVRRRLGSALRSTELYDGNRFAQSMEAAFLEMQPKHVADG